MKRPTKCPICGDKIVRVVNAQTKQSYFKCSNKNCSFVLSSNYTDEEFHLQGQKLKTTCLKCHQPLTVANGPAGLYPKCYNCDCDSRPTTYNGIVFHKWVNAHRDNAKNEVQNLINSFCAKNLKDELYDFEATISGNNRTSSENKHKGRKSFIKENILKLFESDESKIYSAKDISAKIGATVTGVRVTLILLKKSKKVKVVGAKLSNSGYYTLYYQLHSSAIPEIKIYTKKDKYNSITSFLKENTHKYGAVSQMHGILSELLEKEGVDSVLFKTSRTICKGYDVRIMQKLLDDEFKRTQINEIKPSINKKVMKSKKHVQI